MPLHFEYSLNHFTPAEAQEITGASVTLQRDWRRRGILPQNVGHARFDVHDLAHLYFLAAMSERGIGPKVASRSAEIASGGIAMGALLHAEAFEGDRHDFHEGRDLARSVVMATSPSKIVRRIFPNQYLVIYADGEPYWCPAVDMALRDVKPSETEKKLAGPILVLDQIITGAVMFERIGRPLVHIKRVQTK